MKINKKYVKKDLLNNAVIISKEENEDTIYKLNETAALIWDGINKKMSKEDISQEICNKYNAEYKVVKDDVETIISEFISHGFIEE